ncbi:MAG: hypothetical protein IJQ82_05395, partial [Selenomonadaceae bacterium]|nr:hypothetical protein [Selenomonadaceae bacterium]
SYGKYRDDLAALMNVAPTVALTAILSPGLGETRAAIEAYRKEIDEFQKERAKIEDEAAKKNEERQKLIESSLGLSGLTIEQSQKLEGMEERLNEERVKREQETADIIYKINSTSYENSLRDLENWKAEQLRIIEETEEMIKNVTGQDVTLEDERGALDDNYAAKQIQLEEEKEARLSEIRQRIAAADQTEFARRMSAIEQEKESWIQAGMEKAEAETLAEQQKASYINSVNQELSGQIQALNQSDLEKRLAQIEKEKQAWLNKGANIAQAEQLAQEKIRQEYQKTEEKLNEIRRSVAASDNSELENKLANIEKERQAWIQLGMDKVEAEELAQQKISNVVEEEEQKRAQIQEQYVKQVQATREEAHRKNKQAQQDAINILKSEAEEFAAYLKGGESALKKIQYKKLIESGVDPSLIKKMTAGNYLAYKSAKERVSPLPNWSDPYFAKPVKLPENFKAASDAAINAAKSLDSLADAARDATVARQSAPYEEITPSTNPLKVYEHPDGTLEISNLKEFADTAQQSLDVLGEQAGKTAEQLSTISNEDYNLSGLENFSDELQNATQPLEGISDMLQEAVQSLNEIPQVVQGVTESFSGLEMPQFSDMGNLLASMEPQIQNFTQQISNMGIGVNEVTVKLSDLSTILGNMSFQQSNSNASEERTPVEVNTTVQIDEAHAWDYDHIQELAEKVADILEPRIISAIGGGSNSY